jgi:DnaJ-class molecular chaperone
VPTSLVEAYVVLNVHADTSKRVIKGLVTALRQTWHPDHAKDENERRFRTAKIQRINVAWDIVEKLHPLP